VSVSQSGFMVPKSVDQARPHAPVIVQNRQNETHTSFLRTFETDAIQVSSLFLDRFWYRYARTVSRWFLRRMLVWLLCFHLRLVRFLFSNQQVSFSGTRSSHCAHHQTSIQSLSSLVAGPFLLATTGHVYSGYSSYAFGIMW
jgi:hypothetical protein